MPLKGSSSGRGGARPFRKASAQVWKLCPRPAASRAALLWASAASLRILARSAPSMTRPGTRAPSRYSTTWRTAHSWRFLLRRAVIWVTEGTGLQLSPSRETS